MAKEFLTDEAVEDEIARLNASEYVKLARKEQRIKYKRRQYMYILRQLDKHGRQLASEGVTMESLGRLESETDGGISLEAAGK